MTRLSSSGDRLATRALRDSKAAFAERPQGKTKEAEFSDVIDRTSSGLLNSVLDQLAGLEKEELRMQLTFLCSVALR